MNKTPFLFHKEFTGRCSRNGSERSFNTCTCMCEGDGRVKAMCLNIEQITYVVLFSTIYENNWKTPVGKLNAKFLQA